MSTLQITFAIVSAVTFLLPFFVWGALRFWDKQSRKVVAWHRVTILVTFVVCGLLFLTFLLLALFLN